MAEPLQWSQEYRTHAERLCPACGEPHTATGQIGVEVAEEPEAGDVIVCVACLGVLIVTEDLGTRVATEADALPPETTQVLEQMRRELQARWPGAGSRRQA